MLKIAYIAHPYRGKDRKEVLENILKAQQYARVLYRNFGFLPYVPHLITQTIWGYDTSAEGIDKEIVEHDMMMLARCDVLVVCGPRISRGMAAEIEQCSIDKKPVFVLTENGLLGPFDRGTVQTPPRVRKAKGK